MHEGSATLPAGVDPQEWVVMIDRDYVLSFNENAQMVFLVSVPSDAPRGKYSYTVYVCYYAVGPGGVDCPGRAGFKVYDSPRTVHVNVN
ncbi:hypothetical protein D6783_02205 [Candidatus Woesearchaeota archaeon]|nr:MAG: hypothetical protein D6783_02205 [Candidatus Woesearchaeota archaeon]